VVMVEEEEQKLEETNINNRFHFHCVHIGFK
jgi:hypothetical protein